jgi:two-component system, NtrC family, sensor kinase
MTKEKSGNSELDQVRELISDAYKMMNSNPEKCIKLSRSALKISQKVNYPVGIGMAYMHIGLGFFHQSDYYNAQKNYLLAEPFFQQENFWFGLRSLYNNMGLVYNQWGDLEMALKYFKRNLELESKFNDPKLSSTILNSIGGVYDELQDTEKALHYFQESLLVCEKYDLPYMLSVACSNIGKMYMKLQDSVQAEKYFKRSIAAKEKIEDFTGLSYVYLNRTKLYVQNKDYENALLFLERSEHFARQVSEIYILSNIFLKFAEIYDETDDEEKQLFYIKKCYELAESNNFQYILLEATNLLSAFYEKRFDYEKSLSFFKKSQLIKDELSNEKKNKAIQELKIQMEVERTEREKQVLQQKNAELIEKNIQIQQQKDQLQHTEKQLKELNQHLEERVQQETDKRRWQEQIIIQKSKLESLGQLAAGIAHEINQPLGLINISLQNLFRKVEMEKLSDEYLCEKRAFINQNIDRIKRIIEHIRLFSRDQQNNRNERFDIAETLENALSMISTQCSNHNINIIKEISSAGMATLGNKYRFEQVILNLLSNAKDALEDKFDEYDDNKKISIRLFPEDNRIFLEIEDNGCGIEKSHLEHVFEPFFTTKSENKGTGLGLSICYGIIQDMDGKISIESKINQYTLLRVELQNIS